MPFNTNIYYARQKEQNIKHASRTSIKLQSLTSTYRCLRICPSELGRIFAGIHILVFGCPFLVRRSWATGWSAKDQQINQLGCHRFPTLCLQRYNKFQSLPSQKSFRNSTKQKTLLLTTEICRLRSPSEKLVWQNRFYTRAIEKT